VRSGWRRGGIGAGDREELDQLVDGTQVRVAPMEDLRVQPLL
jgi:hypothetical protein